MTGHADFAGRSALVVGGTSGIGAAIAAHLHDLGAHVVAAGLPSSVPEPPGAHVEHMDLLKGDELEALIARPPGSTSSSIVPVSSAGTWSTTPRSSAWSSRST